MENPSPDTVTYSHEQNIAPAKVPAKPIVHKKEKPILLRVFYKVFLGFFVEIAAGIFNFFKRYLVLIWKCLTFLWWPNADEHTKANEKTLNNTKETFEFILIITGITLFFIKQGIIVSTEELKNLYGNDISQYLMELFLFLIYSMAFFVVLIILVLVGRLLRKIFKPIETRDVTDKVFINLNNTFFIGTVIYSFVRKFDPSNSTDIKNVDNDWYILWGTYYAIPLAVIVFIFFIRLVSINKLTIGRVFTYGIVAPGFC